MNANAYDEFSNCLHADQVTNVDEQAHTFACFCLTCGKFVGAGSIEGARSDEEQP